MSNNNPLVSVLMPVYNGEKYLECCIDSIINQTFMNWELIAVNDGSSDNSKNILLEYQNKDSRIKVINLTKNKGVVYCLNLAIEKSSAEYLVRMDADDIMYEYRLSRQYNFMLNNPNVGVLGSNVDIINQDGKIISIWKYPNSNSDLKKMMLKKTPFAHPAVIFRKKFTEKNNPLYSSKYQCCEDYELWIKLHKLTDFYSDSLPTIQYRVHEGQITQSKLRKVSKDTFRLVFNSVILNKINVRALLYLFKPLFYIISPNWLIKIKMERRNKKNMVY